MKKHERVSLVNVEAAKIWKILDKRRANADSVKQKDTVLKKMYKSNSVRIIMLLTVVTWLFYLSNPKKFEQIISYFQNAYKIVMSNMSNRSIDLGSGGLIDELILQNDHVRSHISVVPMSTNHVVEVWTSDIEAFDYKIRPFNEVHKLSKLSIDDFILENWFNPESILNVQLYKYEWWKKILISSLDWWGINWIAWALEFDNLDIRIPGKDDHWDNTVTLSIVISLKSWTHIIWKSFQLWICYMEFVNMSTGIVYQFIDWEWYQDVIKSPRVISIVWNSNTEQEL